MNKDKVALRVRNRIYARKYRAEHKDKIQSYQRKYRKKYYGEYLVYQRKYYQKKKFIKDISKLKCVFCVSGDPPEVGRRDT